MGIPLFWVSLLTALGLDRKKYCSMSKPANIKTLSIDANTVFHVAANYAERVGEFDNEALRQFVISKSTSDRFAEIIRLTIDFLKQIIRYYSPSDAVIIAVDGPIPMTKIQQQKQRRYKTAMLRESELGYDGNMITPGTDFMHKLDEAIHSEIYDKKYQFNVKQIIYSSHRAEGEGEHKIFEYLHNEKKYDLISDPDGHHVVYGNDSDLILLCMMSRIQNIHISKGIPLDVGGEKFVNDQFNELIDIEDLRKHINAQIIQAAIDLGKVSSEVTDDELYTIADIDDFVFAMSFVGNDFLPTIAIMCNMSRSLKYIIDGLAEFGHIVNDDGSVNWLATKNFIRYLSLIETSTEKFKGLGQILRDSEVATATDSGFIPLQSQLLNFKNETGGVDYSMFRSGWYVKALGPIYDSKPSSFQIKNSDIKKMCSSYLQGLVWVYQYYKEGHNSVTWLWYYPYFYAPMLFDLEDTLESISDLSFKEIETVTPYNDELRFNVLHQLVAVMPRQSIKHVPELLWKYYADNSAVSPLMPSQGIRIDDDLIEREYQAKIILPMANYFRIVNELRDLRLTEQDIARYGPREAIANKKLDADEATRYIQTQSRKIVGSYLAERNKRRQDRQETQPTSRPHDGNSSHRGTSSRGHRGRGRSSRR